MERAAAGTAARLPAALLSDNNRLTELDRILVSFNEIAAEQRGEVKAVVTTAEVGAGLGCSWACRMGHAGMKRLA